MGKEVRERFTVFSEVDLNLLQIFFEFPLEHGGMFAYEVFLEANFYRIFAQNILLLVKSLLLHGGATLLGGSSGHVARFER